MYLLSTHSTSQCLADKCPTEQGHELWNVLFVWSNHKFQETVINWLTLTSARSSIVFIISCKLRILEHRIMNLYWSFVPNAKIWLRIFLLHIRRIFLNICRVDYGLYMCAISVVQTLWFLNQLLIQCQSVLQLVPAEISTISTVEVTVPLVD